MKSKKIKKSASFQTNAVPATHLFFQSPHYSEPPSGDLTGGLPTEVRGPSPFSSAVSSQLPKSQWESLLRWAHRSRASWGTGNDSLVSVRMSESTGGKLVTNMFHVSHKSERFTVPSWTAPPLPDIWSFYQQCLFWVITIHTPDDVSFI